MAQGAVALPMQNGLHAPELSAEDIREIQEYEKIVKFRDAVLAGTHPTVKIPAHLLGVGKQISSTPTVDPPHVSPDQSRQHGAPTSNVTSEKSTPDLEHISDTGRASSGGSSALAKSAKPETISTPLHISRSEINGALAKPARSEINPILLEKSDDLIKAEMQLQRHRLERALREQLEHQNASKKALVQAAESFPSFDLSKVLAQALEKVPPVAVVEVEPSLGAASASDSFDENTFYSSQHDTPEPPSPVQAHKVPLTQSESRAAADKVTETQREHEPGSGGDAFMTGAIIENFPLAQSHSQQQQFSVVAGNASLFGQTPVLASAIQVDGTAEHGAMREQGLAKTQEVVAAQAEVSPRHDSTGTTGTTLGANPQEPAHIRVHELAPEMPRPSRVSPLATAREPPVLQEIVANIPPPAQVAALRNEASGVSSTASSPKGGKGPEKKKDKKKKRRNGSNKETMDIADPAPPIHIKTEPRSVSPYEIPSMPRPAKRQRQAGNNPAELNYDEPRYDTAERGTNQYADPRPKQVERYDHYAVPQTAEPAIRRYEIDESHEHRPSERYVRRPQSPQELDLQYAPFEMRPMRVASTVAGERRIYREPRYYSDAQTMPRASVRPDADRERSRSPICRERSTIPMAPPRQPVQRIIVDAYGREYIDPSPAPSMRQSLVPRQREPEVVYERTPFRSVSGRVPADVIEEDSVMYRRASPAIAQPRRVITQPEYVQPDYRSYRQREYSVRPNGEEFIRIREVPEHRQVSQFEELPRGYVARAPSVRPETVKYEVPREYAPRLSSVRPEPPLREYAASVHPEARREMVGLPVREYSVRPVESSPRREYVMEGDGVRRYEGDARRPAELAFIEQPSQREASVLVYADDVRRVAREVYR